jgi:hypothetical protein
VGRGIVMEPELLKELASIRDGDITDPERVRQALYLARESIDGALDAIIEQKDLLKAATEAFMEGWPQKPLRLSG